MSPKVSVIIPVYNTGKDTVKLVMKIKNGTYKNLEIILVDDGSTDETTELLEEFVRQYKIKYQGKKVPKLRLLQKENGGAASARNAGLEKATGEYISFVDSDDSIDKTFYEKMINIVTKENDNNFQNEELTKKENVKTGKRIALKTNASNTSQKIALAVSAVHYNRISNHHEKDIYTNHAKERLEDETFKEYILKLFFTDGRLYASTNKLYRADIIEHFNIRFDESRTFAEDTKFVLDYLNAASRVGFTGINFVYEPLYFYNFGTETSVVKNSSLSWGNWRKSYGDVEKFAGRKKSKLTEKYLDRIYFRFKVAHALAVARSTQTFEHKLQHVGFFSLIFAELIVKFRR